MSLQCRPTSMLAGSRGANPFRHLLYSASAAAWPAAPQKQSCKARQKRALRRLAACRQRAAAGAVHRSGGGDSRACADVLLREVARAIAMRAGSKPVPCYFMAGRRQGDSNAGTAAKALWVRQAGGAQRSRGQAMAPLAPWRFGWYGIKQRRLH